MKKIFLALAAVAIAFTVSAQYKAPQVIANGGYHQAPSSGAKNTMSALKAAQKLKIYGTECDVNLTKDGHVVVVPNGWHPNRKTKLRAIVQRTTLEKMLTIPHINGEYISTLEDFLKRVKKKPATKLIIEIQDQASPKHETKLVAKVLDIVEKAGMQNNVEYVAMHPWTCFQLAKRAPKGSRISYMESKYDPIYVKGMGCTSVSYNLKTLAKKPHWITMAHKLGLTVNAWTVNKDEHIRWCIQNGVDYITTDNPALVKNIINDICYK